MYLPEYRWRLERPWRDSDGLDCEEVAGNRLASHVPDTGNCDYNGVVVQVSHSSGLFMGRPNLQEWHSPLWMLLIGLVVGAATTVMGLTSGTLLVPALYFLSGMRGGHGNYAAPAVALSVLVVALTSTLPAAAYGKRGLVDVMYRTPVVLAAIAGGFCGGLLLTHVMERVVIVFSAVVAMFLCARELSRLAYADKE